MAERPTRILLADDEQSILTLLSYPLRQDGYDVVRASSGAEALERFAESEFDLVVLDVMMPSVDGLEVCRRMRASSSVPIIMLTAKTEEIDKVLGLELGADDYITKPFSIREFRSRVKAALRRSSMRPPPRAPTATEQSEPLEAGELRLDFDKRTLRIRDEVVRTTFVEFEILGAARTPPRPRVHPRGAARADLGRLRLPRPAHDRRPHPPPAREDRARPQGARLHLHRARRRLPLPRPRREVDGRLRDRGQSARGARGRHAGVPSRERAGYRSPLLRSIRTRLALIFFLITLLAVAVIYVVVAPPLTSSLQTEIIRGLQQRATPYVSPESHLHSLGAPTPAPTAETKRLARVYANWAQKAHR